MVGCRIFRPGGYRVAVRIKPHRLNLAVKQRVAVRTYRHEVVPAQRDARVVDVPGRQVHPVVGHCGGRSAPFALPMLRRKEPGAASLPCGGLIELFGEWSGHGFLLNLRMKKPPE